MTRNDEERVSDRLSEAIEESDWVGLDWISLDFVGFDFIVLMQVFI